MRFLTALIYLGVLLGTNAIARAESTPATDFRPMNYSAIRGANYNVARGQAYEQWLNYDPKETERDLDYARKIGINQVRVFLSYPAYAANKEAFRKNLLHLVRACAARGIGLMPVMFYQDELLREPAPYARSRALVKDVVDTIGREPGLACWDAGNEPDIFGDSPDTATCTALARAMAKLYRELDPQKPRTPVTIGFVTQKSMMANSDVVDVLSYHDYSPLQRWIRDNIASAKAFSARVGKPVICTEIGCTARGNPYDLAIENFAEAGIGFYVWELMVTSYLGDMHGIFYPDGTVRDPSIAAAMLGIYRNRGESAVPEFPDREGLVTRVVTFGRNWLAKPDGAFPEGVDLAENAANLLEANQLVAMHDLPTRRVIFLRKNRPDPAALRATLKEFIDELAPYQRPPKAK